MGHEFAPGDVIERSQLIPSEHLTEFEPVLKQVRQSGAHFGAERAMNRRTTQVAVDDDGGQMASGQPTIAGKGLKVYRVGHYLLGSSSRALLVEALAQLGKAMRQVVEPAVEEVFLRCGSVTGSKSLKGCAA